MGVESEKCDVKNLRKKSKVYLIFMFRFYITKKWLSGLKRQTVNLLSFLIVGSNPAFFSFSKYNAAVACLLWEQKVMCSNHIISINYLKYEILYELI